MDQATMSVTGPGSAAIWQTAFWLLVIVTLILLLGWLARRVSAFGQAGSFGRMKVLSMLPLGNRERLVLVQVGRQRLLLGVTPASVNTLHTFEDDDDLAAAGAEVNVAAADPTLFQTVLQKTLFPGRAVAAGSNERSVTDR